MGTKNVQQVIVSEAFRRNEKVPAAKKLTDIELGDLFCKKLGEKTYLRNISNLRSMYNRGVLPWTGGKPNPPKRPSRRYNWDGTAIIGKARYIGTTRDEWKSIVKAEKEKASGKAKTPVAGAKGRVKVRAGAKADRPAAGNASGKKRDRNKVGKGKVRVAAKRDNPTIAELVSA